MNASKSLSSSGFFFCNCGRITVSNSRPLAVCIVMKWRLSGEDLVAHHTERVNVGPMVGSRICGRLLRCHVSRSAQRGADFGEGAPWYSVLAPWARPALLVATAIFAFAGIVNYEMVDTDSQVAYDSVIESATAGVGRTSEELLSIERGTEGAALSYYLSH